MSSPIVPYAGKLSLCLLRFSLILSWLFVPVVTLNQRVWSSSLQRPTKIFFQAGRGFTRRVGRDLARFLIGARLVPNRAGSNQPVHKPAPLAAASGRTIAVSCSVERVRVEQLRM